MKSFSAPLLLGLVGLGVAGCGPLQAPLPCRPDAKDQRAIDAAWDRALHPVGRFDHQGLLDLLTASKAYEAGVDRLTFRSEKRVAAGKVVMEAHYDRSAPAEDRFEVRVLDAAGRLLRHECYGREEVEKTYQDLFVEYDNLRRQKEHGTAGPEEVNELARLEARVKAIKGVFPKPDYGMDQNGRPGRGNK